MRFWFFILMISVLPALVSAETRIEVNLQPDSGTVEDNFLFEVTVFGAQAGMLSAPLFEMNNDFEVENAGTSTRLAIVNGARSLQLTFQFQFVPHDSLKPGKYPVPRGYFVHEGQKVYLKQPTIEIVAADAPANAQGDAEKKISGMDFVHVVDNTEPYRGQQLLYRAEVASPYEIAEAKIDDQDFSGFLRESFGKAREQLRGIANSNVQVYSVREALFPSQTGTMQIPTRRMELTVQAPLRRKLRRSWSMLDDIFPDLLDEREPLKKVLFAEPLKINVKPLPAPPPGITGFIPVGNVKFDYGIDRVKVQEGDSVNLWLELDGDANLRPFEISLPTLTADGNFKIYADKPTVETRIEGDRIMFRKRFQFGLVPQRFGSLPFPQIRFATFDPAKGEYQIRELPLKALPVDADPSRKSLPYDPSAVAPKATPTSPMPQDEPKELPQVQNDLLPLHAAELVGEQRLAGVPRPLLLLMMGLALGAALARRFSAHRREKFLRDPLLKRELAAWTKARSELEGSERVVGSELSRIIRSYLTDRLRVHAEGLTSNDVERVLGAKIQSVELRRELASLMEKLERASYGAKEGVSAEQSGEVRSILERIEASLA